MPLSLSKCLLNNDHNNKGKLNNTTSDLIATT